MFKKFFNWIKSIFNKIDEMKQNEFRRKLGIYYVPEDFHTNPKYDIYQNLYSSLDYKEPSFFEKMNIYFIFNKFANAMLNAVATLVVFIGAKMVYNHIH